MHPRGQSPLLHSGNGGIANEPTGKKPKRKLTLIGCLFIILPLICSSTLLANPLTEVVKVFLPPIATTIAIGRTAVPTNTPVSNLVTATWTLSSTQTPNGTSPLPNISPTVNPYTVQPSTAETVASATPSPKVKRPKQNFVTPTLLADPVTATTVIGLSTATKVIPMTTVAAATPTTLKVNVTEGNINDYCGWKGFGFASNDKGGALDWYCSNGISTYGVSMNELCDHYYSLNSASYTDVHNKDSWFCYNG